ncbi:MAG: TonB family protein, partial [Cyclobacteriaceae bacterium]|nr:TonB family protein [Cyclobacteriaceae bacterium]
APEEKEEEPVDELITLTAPQVVEEELGNTNIAAQTQVDLVSQSSAKQKPLIPQKEIELTEPLVAVADISGDMAKEEEDVSQLEEIVHEPASEDAGISAEAQPVQSRARVAKKSRSSASVRLVDQKEPDPIGGMASLKSYINQNLAYPQEAIDNNIKGTVVLEVSINTDGSIAHITVSKGLGNGCDAEAMRLISTGPKWIPKVENGKAVKSSRQVKIKFKN